MASAYPTGLDTFAINKANATTTATDHPNHHNDLADAVNKIEAELGIAPSGTFATVLARFNSIQTEVDYVEYTANVSPTATSEATANTVVTATAVSFDGVSKALIEFYSPTARPDNAAASRSLNFMLYDGSSSIGFFGVSVTPATGSDSKPIYLARRLTPSNASHTYSVRAFVNVGTGLVGAGAGGVGNNVPGFIRISKIG